MTDGVADVFVRGHRAHNAIPVAVPRSTQEKRGVAERNKSNVNNHPATPSKSDQFGGLMKPSGRDRFQFDPNPKP